MAVICSHCGPLSHGAELAKVSAGRMILFTNRWKLGDLPRIEPPSTGLKIE